MSREQQTRGYNCTPSRCWLLNLVHLVCSVSAGKYCLRFLSHRPCSFVARPVYEKPQAILSRTDLTLGWLVQTMRLYTVAPTQCCNEPSHWLGPKWSRVQLQTQWDDFNSLILNRTFSILYIFDRNRVLKFHYLNTYFNPTPLHGNRLSCSSHTLGTFYCYVCIIKKILRLVWKCRVQQLTEPAQAFFACDYNVMRAHLASFSPHILNFMPDIILYANNVRPVIRFWLPGMSQKKWEMQLMYSIRIQCFAKSSFCK